MNIHLSSIESTDMSATFNPHMGGNNVSLHLGRAGIFMTPQEARELATKLMNAAVQADAYVPVAA